MITRKILIVFAPAIGFALAVAAWSAYWYIAMGKISTLLDERASAKGYDLACASRQNSGYPLRFEIRCAGLHMTSKAAGQFELLAPAAVITLPSYNPTRLRILLTGPVKTELGPTPQRPQRLSVTLRADRVPVSIQLRKNELGDIAVHLGRFRAEITSWEGGRPATSIKAAGDGLTGTLAGQAGGGHPPGTGQIKLAARSLKIRTIPPFIAGISEALIHEIKLTALIDKMPALQGRTTSERLARWQKASGRLYGISARARSDILDVDANGQLALDETGRLNGKINTATTGLDQFLGRLVDNKAIKRKTAVLVLTAANLVSRPKSKAGRDAIHLPVSFFDGKLYYGPFGIARLKPLF